MIWEPWKVNAHFSYVWVFVVFKIEIITLSPPHWRPPSVSIPILHYGNIAEGNSDSHHHHGPHLWTRLCWADARLLDGHLSAIPSRGLGSRLLTTWIENNNIFIFIFHTNFSLFLLTINKHVVCSHLCCIGPEARDAVGHISVNPEIFYILSFCNN